MLADITIMSGSDPSRENGAGKKLFASYLKFEPAALNLQNERERLAFFCAGLFLPPDDLDFIGWRRNEAPYDFPEKYKNARSFIDSHPHAALMVSIVLHDHKTFDDILAGEPPPSDIFDSFDLRQPVQPVFANAYGLTPLMVAALCSNAAAVKKILAHPLVYADMTSGDEERTALYHATRRTPGDILNAADIEIIEELVKHGADKKAINGKWLDACRSINLNGCADAFNRIAAACSARQSDENLAVKQALLADEKKRQEKLNSVLKKMEEEAQAHRLVVEKETSISAKDFFDEFQGGLSQILNPVARYRPKDFSDITMDKQLFRVVLDLYALNSGKKIGGLVGKYVHLFDVDTFSYLHHKYSNYFTPQDWCGIYGAADKKGLPEICDYMRTNGLAPPPADDSRMRFRP